MSAYTVACATYNGHLAKGHHHSQGNPCAWLIPAFSDGTSGGSGRIVDDAPAFVVVGFQEIIPLHLALAGLTDSALKQHDEQLLSVLESLYTASQTSSKPNSTRRYKLLSQKALGGIALLVYARRDVADRVRTVEVSTVGCGILGLMGNKGAVGIRVTLVEPESGREEKGSGGGESSWTFVSAHLAAHQSDKCVRRRNEDWRSIVERLVFVGENGEERQLFDSGNVFFFGDLNYRISLTSPSPLSLDLLSQHITTLTSSASSTSPLSSACSTLLSHDQLTQERRAERTLHHLREGPIAHPPSYKFKLGSRDEYTSFQKRVPGWTDRVLYASAGGDEVEVKSYRSVMDCTMSDHKPVAAVFSLPSSAASSSLPFSSPFPIDPSWRTKRLIGLLLDRLVGSAWCILMLAGFNRSAKVGMFILLAAVVAVYYVWR
ncbi:hypothetical protein JCM11641_000248 [Rhodosporidiobolus odoratus]